MQYISIPFGLIMRFCYNLLANYGLAILLFTVITKIILLPVSLWTQQNSVRFIKIQPQLNRIKARYYGEKDKISDEQLALYKKERYNPFLGILPMLIQLFLLVCLIQIIYNPLTHILALPSGAVKDIVQSVCAVTGIDVNMSSIQLAAVREIQGGVEIGSEYLPSIKALDMSFLGFDLSAMPVKTGGKMLLVPVIAALSSVLLTLSQNRFNPLQAEQGKLSQLSTGALSVGISLILGGFVPAGIGLYWTFSNLFTIAQQFLLNAVINPKKHIDYDALEKSKSELAEIEAIGKKSGIKFGDANYKRQRADYKRFFSVANKHLVIYSESNGFYKYFEKIIDYLLEHSNIIIHYVTSDPNDNIFTLAESEPRIKPYFIGSQKMITLFMKMDADIVLMTMPDLDNFHYKRSYVKKDIEYIYTQHGLISVHMVLNNHALDNYDTVFCIADFQIDEIRKQEELYNLPAKRLLTTGYGFLEELIARYEKAELKEREHRKILIAPSWQKDNILDSCVDALLSELLGRGYEVHLRPHPEYIKRYPAKIDALTGRYKDYGGGDLVFELDFTSSESIYDSDLLITDWSSTAFEFSYVTLKPCLFVDTQPKINNPEYEKLGIEPLEITLRNKIGTSVKPDNLSDVKSTVDSLLSSPEKRADEIRALREKYVAHLGENGKVSGQYIINSLIEKQRSK